MNSLAIFANKKWGRKIVFVVASTAILFAFTASAASQINTILTNLQDTIQIVLKIMITLAIVVFISGIVKLIAAAGNPQMIKQAKSIIALGIISLAVLATLTGIIAFLQTYFGISPGNPIKVPQF